MITILERIFENSTPILLYENILFLVARAFNPKLSTKTTYGKQFTLVIGDSPEAEEVLVSHYQNDVLNRLHITVRIHEQHLEWLEQPILAVESTLLPKIRNGDIIRCIQELCLPRTLGSYHEGAYLTAEQLIEKYQINKKCYPRVLITNPN